MSLDLTRAIEAAAKVIYGEKVYDPDWLVTKAVEDAAPSIAEQAWDEGFKQGGPMHDVNYDDPDAHTRNPYRAASIEDS